MQPSMMTAFATARFEGRQHHLAEYAAGHAAARIDNDDVAGLASYDRFPMQFPFRRGGVFIAPMHIFALGHELQGDSLAGDGLARVEGCQADEMRVADAFLRQCAGDGRRADFAEAVQQLLLDAIEFWNLLHMARSRRLYDILDRLYHLHRRRQRNPRRLEWSGAQW